MTFLIIIFVIIFLIWLSSPSTSNTSRKSNYTSNTGSQTKTTTNTLKDETLEELLKKYSSLNSHNQVFKPANTNTVQEQLAKKHFDEARKAASEGDNKLALAKYNQAITIKETLNQQNSTYYNNRAIVRDELNDYSGSIVDYNKAISIDPKNTLYLVNRGMTHHNRGFKILSKADWEKAASLGNEKAKEYLKKYFENAPIATASKPPQNITPNKVPTNTFQPNLEHKFGTSNLNGEYNWYAIYNYYPKNRFSQEELSTKDIQARQHVYSFKDGKNPPYYANMFASALINKFGKTFFSGKYILIVPASNKAKTQVRFQRFCATLSENLGAINGFNLLNNNDKEKTPSHNGGNRNEDLEQYLTISDILIDKNVIIIDDVRTSGASSNQVFRILKKRRVKEMTFVYLAKTVSLNSAPDPFDPFDSNFDNDDLPF
ncbi:MAG: hypothetical protein RL624_1225 [Bacteroidota bacterium]|jgi:tetratricopeptide (TPR) repeat protein